MNENQTKIINIEENMLHEIAELICFRCSYRYIAVYPANVLLKNLVCPKCGKPEFMIKTGQTLEDMPIQVNGKTIQFHRKEKEK